MSQREAEEHYEPGIKISAVGVTENKSTHKKYWSIQNAL